MASIKKLLSISILFPKSLLCTLLKLRRSPLAVTLIDSFMCLYFWCCCGLCPCTVNLDHEKPALFSIHSYDGKSQCRFLAQVGSLSRRFNLFIPEEFRPERFLGKAIDVKGQDFELLPFGSGRWMCPRYALGLKVIQASLANLLHGVEWKLPL